VWRSQTRWTGNIFLTHQPGRNWLEMHDCTNSDFIFVTNLKSLSCNSYNYDCEQLLPNTLLVIKLVHVFNFSYLYWHTTSDHHPVPWSFVLAQWSVVLTQWSATMRANQLPNNWATSQSISILWKTSGKIMPSVRRLAIFLYRIVA